MTRHMKNAMLCPLELQDGDRVRMHSIGKWPVVPVAVAFTEDEIVALAAELKARGLNLRIQNGIPEPHLSSAASSIIEAAQSERDKE